jgi:hypothetical protein
MPKFNRQFIGYEYPGESLLKQNVYYKYNNLGHRCKNADEIDLDNYILFAGCSHTFGEGLNVEQTYPYITAKNLDCDYYNLGIPASGIDVLFYNVMMWLSLHKKPKLLVLQYPDHTRFSSITYPPLVLPYGAWSSDSDIIDVLTKSEDKGLFAFRNLCYTQLINTIDLPKVKLIFGGTKPYDSDCVRIDKLDYAVDQQHYGFETHTFAAELIVNKYAHAKIIR